MKVDGTNYATAADVARELDVSRQTLWRWRRDGKIPTGQRYRDRRILYTQAEVEQIHAYANRIEPISDEESRQLGLFGRESAKT